MTTRRISLLLGNLIELAGTILGVLSIALAPLGPLSLSFPLYLVAWFCFLFFPHGLVHYIIGELVGVRFRYYSLGRSSVSKIGVHFLEMFGSKLLVFTLRVDQESLRLVAPLRGSIMFASGAVASMILPFVPAILSFGRLPLSLSVLLLLISVGNLVFDLFYSPKAGDISRAKSASRN